MYSGVWRLDKDKALKEKPDHDWHKEVHLGLKIDGLSIKGEWTLSEALDKYCTDPNKVYNI